MWVLDVGKNQGGLSSVSESSLALYTSPIKKMDRPLIGREGELDKLQAALSRPEYCNVVLLAAAGTGKTALVQGLCARDKSRIYLEVDLAKMIADLHDVNEMASRLKMLFFEVEQFHKKNNRNVVLFMDEFHQVVQLSSAAVEALKPLLADSGTRGIQVITATTLREFNEFIAPNQPLVERLQRINVPEPGRSAVLSILKSFAEKYDVADEIHDSIYDLIYEYTNRYIPANAQPRKSILVLDAMIGYYRSMHRRMDKRLLADVIYQSEGINVNFKVDAASLERNMNKAVFDQGLATFAIAKGLQIAVADFNPPGKPMGVFLFAGSTGTGKTALTKELARLLFGGDRNDGDVNQSGNRNLIRFDMSEFSRPESAERFRRELTTRVWERPFSVVLLDEIEKSSGEITRMLLPVLDDGVMTDTHERQVVFSNTYIIMTTNAGSEVFRDIGKYNVSDGTAESQKQALERYTGLIRDSISKTTGDNRFPVELLGRFDCIVPFMPLSEDTMSKIVKRALYNLVQDTYRKHGVELVMHNRVLDYLVKDNISTDTNAGGARHALSKMRDEVTAPVAAYLNSHDYVTTLVVDIDGKMAFESKNRLLSEARVVVGEPE